MKFIYNKTKDRHFEESLLPICGVQHNIGDSISLLLARIQYGNDISQTTTNNIRKLFSVSLEVAL